MNRENLKEACALDNKLKDLEDKYRRSLDPEFKLVIHLVPPQEVPRSDCRPHIKANAVVLASVRAMIQAQLALDIEQLTKELEAL